MYFFCVLVSYVLAIWFSDPGLGVRPGEVSSTWGHITIHPLTASCCKYAILENTHLNTNEGVQIVECVSLSEKQSRLAPFRESQLSGDSRNWVSRSVYSGARAENRPPDGVSRQFASRSISSERTPPLLTLITNTIQLKAIMLMWIEREIKQDSEMFHLGSNELISQGIKNPR